MKTSCRTCEVQMAPVAINLAGEGLYFCEPCKSMSLLSHDGLVEYGEQSRAFLADDVRSEVTKEIDDVAKSLVERGYSNVFVLAMKTNPDGVTEDTSRVIGVATRAGAPGEILSVLFPRIFSIWPEHRAAVDRFFRIVSGIEEVKLEGVQKDLAGLGAW